LAGQIGHDDRFQVPRPDGHAADVPATVPLAPSPAFDAHASVEQQRQGRAGANAAQAISQVSAASRLDKQDDALPRVDAQDVPNAEQIPCGKASGDPALHNVGTEAKLPQVR
jgi:hypothetical protein